MTVSLLRRAWPLTLLLACTETGPRVYTAQPYDVEAECLREYEALGLVEADDLPADCAATCLDVSGTLYVSSVCPPFPDGATELSPDDEACAAALSADVCE